MHHGILSHLKTAKNQHNALSVIIKPMQKLYSLWITPETKLQNNLKQIVDSLADKYGSPKFEPHMTLLGDVEIDLDTMVKKTKSLASKLTPFQVELGPVSFSTTYFQSVFVRVKANAQLMQANLTAKEIFGQENNVFMPHISLLYGDQDMQLREKAASKIQLPSIQSFKVDQIVITPSTKDPAEWEHLAEIAL